MLEPAGPAAVDIEEDRAGSVPALAVEVAGVAPLARAVLS